MRATRLPGRGGGSPPEQGLQNQCLGRTFNRLEYRGVYEYRGAKCLLAGMEALIQSHLFWGVTYYSHSLLSLPKPGLATQVRSCSMGRDATGNCSEHQPFLRPQWVPEPRNEQAPLANIWSLLGAAIAWEHTAEIRRILKAIWCTLKAWECTVWYNVPSIYELSGHSHYLILSCFLFLFYVPISW